MAELRDTVNLLVRWVRAWAEAPVVSGKTPGGPEIARMARRFQTMQTAETGGRAPGPNNGRHRMLVEIGRALGGVPVEIVKGRVVPAPGAAPAEAPTAPDRDKRPAGRPTGPAGDDGARPGPVAAPGGATVQCEPSSPDEMEEDGRAAPTTQAGETREDATVPVPQATLERPSASQESEGLREQADEDEDANEETPQDGGGSLEDVESPPEGEASDARRNSAGPLEDVDVPPEGEPMAMAGDDAPREATTTISAEGPGMPASRKTGRPESGETRPVVPGATVGDATGAAEADDLEDVDVPDEHVRSEMADGPTGAAGEAEATSPGEANLEDVDVPPERPVGRMGGGMEAEGGEERGAEGAGEVLARVEELLAILEHVRRQEVPYELSESDATSESSGANAFETEPWRWERQRLVQDVVAEIEARRGQEGVAVEEQFSAISSLPSGTARYQVLTWSSDNGPWAADWVRGH